MESWKLGYKILAQNATSVGMGRSNTFFLCMCDRNCIIIIIIIINITSIIIIIIIIINHFFLNI